LSAGVSRPVLERVVAYWRGVEKTVGDRIAAGVGLGGSD
jgi:catalase